MSDIRGQKATLDGLLADANLSQYATKIKALGAVGVSDLQECVTLILHLHPLVHPTTRRAPSRILHPL